MKVVRVSAVFLTLMVACVQQGTPILSDIWDAIKFGYSVSSKMLEGGFAYDLITDDTGDKLDSIYGVVKDIMKDQRELSYRMESNVEIMLNNLAAEIKNDAQFNSLKDRLTHDYIARVNTAYHVLEEASDKKISDNSKFEIAQQLTSFGAGEIHDCLEHIAQLIIPQGSPFFSNFIDVLLEHTALQTTNRCGKGSSLQQEVYHLYELLVATERLAFITLSYAWTIRGKHEKVNVTNDIEIARTGMIDRIHRYMTTIKNAMAKVPTEIHACEPSEYIRNENYIELERLRQLVVVAEKDIDVDYGCYRTCEAFSPHQSVDVAHEINGRGLIYLANCQKCQSAGYTSICYPKETESHRRYFGAFTNLVNHEANSLFGDVFQCAVDDGEGVSPRRDFDSYIDTIISKCDVCVCTCTNHEPYRKWRHSFSLKAEITDLSKNMVVTGIRFHKTSSSTSGQVIYPQIKMGKLLPGGEVSEPVWKEPEIDPDYEPSVTGRGDYVVVGEDEDEVNIVNLDDAYVQADHVITGVKFFDYNDLWRVKRPWYLAPNYLDEGKSLGLVVRMTRCNFTTGELLSTAESTYTHPDVGVDPLSSSLYRYEHRLENSDVPIKATEIKASSMTRNYIRFTRSDTKKDFGQSTVPFFDIQPFETSPPTALSGAGLFLKNEDDFGGFLAWRLMTVNMTNVINDGVPVTKVALTDVTPPHTDGTSLPAGARPQS